jgi:hypothetical protein
MKVKKNAVIFAGLVALLVLAGVYLWGPSKTPSTQKPLTTLATMNFDEFEAAFDETRDAERLVLLLSPT